MNSDFKDLLRIFAEEQVEYLVVGAYAVKQLDKVVRQHEKALVEDATRDLLLLRLSSGKLAVEELEIVYSPSMVR